MVIPAAELQCGLGLAGGRIGKVVRAELWGLGKSYWNNANDRILDQGDSGGYERS